MELVAPSATTTVRLRLSVEWLARHAVLLCLLGIVGAALAVRVVDVVHNPPGFYADEAAYGLNAYDILHSGRDEYGHLMPFLFRSFGDYKLPFFIYAEVPFVAVLGLTALAVRATDAVLGTLTVVAVYLLAREVLRSRWQALAAAALLALEPWHVHFSRTGFGEVVSFPLVFTVALWLFFVSRRRPALIVPAILCFGLSLYTYRAAWPVVPATLAVLAVVYHLEPWIRRRAVFVGLLGLALMCVPIVLHFLSGAQDRTQQTSIFDVTSGPLSLARVFTDHYVSYFTPAFLFARADNGDVLRHYLPGQGVLYWFQLPLIVIGLIAMARSRRRSDIVLLALVVIYPLSGALSSDSPVSSRTLLGAVVFALVSARGLGVLVEAAAERERRATLMLSAAFVAALALSFGVYIQAYSSRYTVVGAGHSGWEYGAGEAESYFARVQAEYDQLLLGDGFDAPQELVRFYAGSDCPNCAVGGADKVDTSKRQLIALTPEGLRALQTPYQVRQVIRLSNGQPALFLVQPEQAGGTPTSQADAASH